MRHAECEDDRSFKHGMKDVQLSDHGRRHAAEYIEAVKRLAPSKIYSSSLARTIQTAKIITEGASEVLIDERVNDNDWSNECVQSFKLRIASFADGLSGGELIVTHGTTARYLQSYLTGEPIGRIKRYEFCEVRKIQIDNIFNEGEG